MATASRVAGVVEDAPGHKRAEGTGRPSKRVRNVPGGDSHAWRLSLARLAARHDGCPLRRRRDNRSTTASGYPGAFARVDRPTNPGNACVPSWDVAPPAGVWASSLSSDTRTFGDGVTGSTGPRE